MPGEKALNQGEADFAANVRFFFGFDTFCQRRRTKIKHQLDEIADDATLARTGAAAHDKIASSEGCRPDA